MGYFDLSSLNSSNGNSRFTGGVEYEILQSDGSQAQVRVTLSAWLTAGYTWATLDGAVTAGSTTIASGNWGGASSAILDSEVVVCTGTAWVSVADGEIYLSASVKITNSGSFSGTITGSHSAAVDSGDPVIPPEGPSTVLLGTASVEMGKELLISIYSANPDYVHELIYTVGDTSVTIATNIQGSYLWKVPDLSQLCGEETYVSCTITCVTYGWDGALWIGETTAPVLLTLPEPEAGPSTISIAVSSVKMGNDLFLSIYSGNPDYVHELIYSIGDTSASFATNVKSSFLWTIPDFSELCTDGESVSCTIECVTYGKDGTTVIGTSSATVTLTLPEPEAGPSTLSLSVSSVQMGKKLLISILRDNPLCTHTLQYTFGSSTVTIATGVGGSYEWTVPDLADQCSNAVSGTCTITCETYYQGQTLGTDTAQLTLIVPDPSVPGITGGTITLGTAATIGCKRSSYHFTLTLKLEFQGTTIVIASGKQDSVTWTAPYSLAKRIPALTEGTAALICITHNGTAEVGTRTATIRVAVPDNEVTRPKFTGDGLLLSPTGILPEAFAGLYLRGKTGLTAVFTASSDYSTIAEYAVTVGSQSATGNPATIDLLVNEGTVKVTGKVTDARGFSTSVELTIPVLPYRNPKILPYSGYSDIICERAMATGELSANGTYLAIKAGRSFTSIPVNGTEQNSCTLHYRWKPNGAAAYTDWIPLLSGSSGESQISLLVGNVVTSLQSSYLVQLEALDALGGSHCLTFQIMTEAISFVLYDGPDGAGFGKYPEEAHVVDIAAHMTLLVRGKLRVLGDEWESLGLMETVSESAYEHGRKETGCFFLVTEGRHVHIAFNCTFAYAGTAVIINASPIPEEHRPDRTVLSLCPANDRQLVCVSVGTDGYIRVEWVQKVADIVQTGAADVTWVDGYLCYWT